MPCCSQLLALDGARPLKETRIYRWARPEFSALLISSSNLKIYLLVFNKIQIHYPSSTTHSLPNSLSAKISRNTFPS